MTDNAPTRVPTPVPAAVPQDGFKDLDSILAQLENRIAAGNAEQLLSHREGFGLSETLQHAAQSISYAMDGYPKLKARAFRSTLGKAAKHLFLSRGAMRHSLTAPLDGAPALDPRIVQSEALASLREAVTRLRDFEGELQPHPSYGVCAVDQAARLQAMHLREHLPGLAASTEAP